MTSETATNRTIGPYHVVELLGEGGMGRVEKCFDPKTQQHVAVKLLHPALMGSGVVVERFSRELQVLLALRSHPHIVTVLDYVNDPFALVMELLDGETLYDRLRSGGAMSIKTGLRYFGQVLDAVGFAHERGILHRDIKSANVMLVRLGTQDHVKVMDFGLAGFVGGSELTRAGSRMGTPAYMAPEQHLGQTISERTDVYALGVLLFEILTGRLPFAESETTDYEIMKAHIEQSVPRATLFAPGLPSAIDEIIATAMHKMPDARFESCAAFALAIENLAHVPSPASSAQSEVVAPTSAALDASAKGEESCAPQAEAGEPSRADRGGDGALDSAPEGPSPANVAANVASTTDDPSEREPSNEEKGLADNSGVALSDAQDPAPASEAASPSRRWIKPVAVVVALVAAAAVILLLNSTGSESGKPREATAADGASGNGESDLVTAGVAVERIAKSGSPEGSAQTGLAGAASSAPRSTGVRANSGSTPRDSAVPPRTGGSGREPTQEAAGAMPKPEGAIVNAEQKPRVAVAQPKPERLHIQSATATSVARPIAKKGIYYDASQAMDGDPGTWWQEGEKDDGEGQSITFVLAQPATVTKIRLMPGYAKVLQDQYGDRWWLNNRLKSVEISFGGATRQSAYLPDEKRWHDIELSPPARSDTVKLTILSVYGGYNAKGKRVRDSGISEIEIWGSR